MDKAYHQFKFKCFGDAYTALQNIFTQGNDMGYVSYHYLLENVNRCEVIAAAIDDEWKDIKELEVKEEFKNFGWLNADRIKIDPVDKNDQTQDVWVLYLPKPRSFEGIINN